MTAFRTGKLRLATALMVVLSMVAAGCSHRSPWLVLLVTPAFTLLYALGKWAAWKAAWRIGGAKQIILAILTTLPIQAILAGVLYLLGLGLGRLIIGYQSITALSVADVLGAGLLLVVGVVLGIAIIRLEGTPPTETVPETESEPPTETEELELDIDPTPVTVDTFLKAPGHGRVNAATWALGGQDVPVSKPPLAASEDMIVAAEDRLGVRLPETLRALYRKMNGGYVDWLYVPLKANPGPFYDDWRGAFSIDYSSLRPVEKLCTVAEHYEDFTHEPEDVPDGAEHLVVLEARYGDMTLLDYSHGPQPRVLLVDYDTYDGEPIDVVFDDFDSFFAALRRPRDRPFREPVRRLDLGRPMTVAPPDSWARRFWGEGKEHPFYANATQRRDGSEPKLEADDDLVAQTHARLGVTLPLSLISLWRSKNGGGVASRYIEVEGRDVEVMKRPVPLEYIVSLAELSDRITFPPGETPWQELHTGADRLIVLAADRDQALLLDYRDRADDYPAVLVVDDIGQSLSEAIRFEHWDELLYELRFQRNGWYEVAEPHPLDLADEP